MGDVNVCRFFPSGLCVLSGGSDFRIKIWSVPDGTCPRTLTGNTRGKDKRGKNDNLFLCIF